MADAGRRGERGWKFNSVQFNEPIQRLPFFVTAASCKSYAIGLLASLLSIVLMFVVVDALSVLALSSNLKQQLNKKRPIVSMGDQTVVCRCRHVLRTMNNDADKNTECIGPSIQKKSQSLSPFFFGRYFAWPGPCSLFLYP